jgi:hypothetical protein
LRHALRKRKWIPVVIVLALVAALGVALFLRAKAPPEAARLLPESDAIVYIHLKTLRAATHFDDSPVARSADFQQFINATGIVPERDLDAAAFALHRMPDPKGPNGPVAYSEVFVGRFDSQKLDKYLSSIAKAKEVYAGHTVYSIPVERRTLRVAQLGVDTVAASNMPTAEQIHSMLDRWRASALGTPGSSLLAARFKKVPIFAEAWGIGHIGLPFAQNGKIALFGLELPVPAETDLVASLRFSGALHLRVEELAPDQDDARKTTESLSTLINIARGIADGGQENTPAAVAMRGVLDSAKAEQKDDTAVLTATATIEQMKALTTAQETSTTPAAAPVPAQSETTQH